MYYLVGKAKNFNYYYLCFAETNTPQMMSRGDPAIVQFVSKFKTIKAAKRFIPKIKGKYPGIVRFVVEKF